MLMLLKKYKSGALVTQLIHNPKKPISHLTIVEAREQVEVEVELGGVEGGRVRGAGWHQVHHLGNFNQIFNFSISFLVVEKQRGYVSSGWKD